jgi:predicted RNase H-like nuclease (RuvC/YqgF family)
MEGMTIDGAVAVITVLIALAGMLSGLFTLAKSTRKEAFDELKQIVDEQKSRLDRQKERIDKLEEENVRLSKKVDEREDEIEDLKDWAERLVEQVQGAGLFPVPFRRRRSGKK